MSFLISNPSSSHRKHRKQQQHQHQHQQQQNYQQQHLCTISIIHLVLFLSRNFQIGVISDLKRRRNAFWEKWQLFICIFYSTSKLDSTISRCERWVQLKSLQIMNIKSQWILTRFASTRWHFYRSEQKNIFKFITCNVKITRYYLMICLGVTHIYTYSPPTLTHSQPDCIINE